MTSESAATPPPQEQKNPELQSPEMSASISAVIPSPPQATLEDVANSNGVIAQKGVDDIEEPYYFNEEYYEKYKTYEAEFKQYLLETYFKEVFEERTVIDGETITSSKWPCTRFYADQNAAYEDRIRYFAGVDDDEEEEVEVEEGEAEAEEEGEEEEEEEEDVLVVDSASAEIAPCEIPNGGIVSQEVKNIS